MERILQTFYDEYPERRDVPAYLELANSWKSRLGGQLQEEMIEAIVLDEFFFHHRLDIWETYLHKQEKKQLRPFVQRVLSQWSQPRVFIGQVVEVDEGYLTAEMILDGEQIKLRRESEKPVPVGVHLYCFILPDGTGVENQFVAVSSLIFFPADHRSVFEQITAQFQEDSSKTKEQFFKENAIEVWEKLAANGYEGEEFSNFEVGVITHFMGFLDEHYRQSEQLLDLVEDYLVEQQPNARKDVAIAAGAIRFGNDYSYFESLDMTVKEIAEWFGVSPSSMNKYYKELIVYAGKE
ncbi:hypothetical protein HNO89_002646 [Sporosarcina luteola]|nr:hypothetical protein [Sporosarcina luteola]